MTAVFHREADDGAVARTDSRDLSWDLYEGNVLRAWEDFAVAAEESPLFGAARGPLGAHRAAYAAVLDCYFRSLPLDGRRLSADHEYFCDRVSALLRELAPPAGGGPNRRVLAGLLRQLRRRGQRGNRRAELLRAVVKLSTSWDTALAAHDAYREYHSRVAPQFADPDRAATLAG